MPCAQECFVWEKQPVRVASFFVQIESSKLSLHLREQDIFSAYHNLQHDSRRFHKKCSLDY